MDNIKKYFADKSIKSSIVFIIDEFIKNPLHLIFYPIQGFDDFKREKKGKSYVAYFYLFMMILVQIISFNANGFLVNTNNSKDFSLFLTIALILFPVLVFVVSNWATTALMDGKGSMTEIFKVLCYSFFPYVWLSLAATIISNYITADEIMFFRLFMISGTTLTGYLLFFGLLSIHEYGLVKTLLMFVFTVVAIAAVLFIILLFFSLIQQVWSFIDSVYSEFVRRFL